MRQKRFKFNISDELLAKMRKVSDKNKITMASFVRQAIEFYLSAQ